MQIFDHKKPETVEQTLDTAKKSITNGCDVIYDILRTVLGPNGALKLMSNETNANHLLTNDGATILKNLVIDSPSAQILINSSISQDKEEGDGTTSVALLAAILVRKAMQLNIHSVKIVSGFEMAVNRCVEILDLLKYEDSLHNLAKTTLCSKILNCDLDHFANICVQAIGKSSDISCINIIKTGGKLEESFFVEDGFILDCDVEIPEPIKNPRIMVANTQMDQDKVKIYGAKIDVQSVKELWEIEDAEKQRMKDKVDSICFNTGYMSEEMQKSESKESLNEANETAKSTETSEKLKKPFFDIFLNRQIMYDLPKHQFKSNKVVPIELVNFEGVERLSKVLNATILSSFYSKTKDSDIGTCKEVSNIIVGDKRMVKFTGISKGAGTIVICGSSKDVLDEAERSIHDALCVLRNKYVVPGGGVVESVLANDLVKFASKVYSSESSAILAFSEALIELVAIIAQNCGLNSENIKAELRSKNNSVDCSFGIDVEKMGISDMKKIGIVESYSVKHRVLTSACEVAQMLIKCDGYVKSKPRERTRM
ncbi:hypothetical protein EDEG_00853 [Edhazardia aedis USNM 41457]|uniref:Uncharacterized protein n=1 Tax=Edhazardia aedis (strain USNM 41457) TaxID=1003232 RepID=J9DUY1_EDHAE|nr:hypothetical protein EDEG_00853 [Edhazardia aedis USNM 41457]|eukprot:EJW05072.1 hypothetical protein EDEG_00853 [Edhazardia aedis USNM 41457]